MVFYDLGEQTSNSLRNIHRYFKPAHIISFIYIVVNHTYLRSRDLRENRIKNPDSRVHDNINLLLGNIISRRYNNMVSSNPINSP